MTETDYQPVPLEGLPISLEMQENMPDKLDAGAYSVYIKTNETSQDGHEIGLKVIIDHADANEDEKYGKPMDLDNAKHWESAANRRKRKVELIQDYLGENVAKYHGSALVDAPKNELRKRTGASEEALIGIPESQTAIMEMWDHIEGDDIFIALSKGELDTGEEYKREAQKFAQKAYTLFLEKQMMLDLGQTGEIDALTETDVKTVKTLDDLEDYISDEKRDALIPRNVKSTPDGKLVLYDTFPVFPVAKAERDSILEKVKSNDFSGIKEVINSTSDEDVKSRLTAIAKYSFMLKDMGANLE